MSWVLLNLRNGKWVYSRRSFDNWRNCYCITLTFFHTYTLVAFLHRWPCSEMDSLSYSSCQLVPYPLSCFFFFCFCAFLYDFVVDLEDMCFGYLELGGEMKRRLIKFWFLWILRSWCWYGCSIACLVHFFCFFKVVDRGWGRGLRGGKSNEVEVQVANQLSY